MFVKIERIIYISIIILLITRVLYINTVIDYSDWLKLAWDIEVIKQKYLFLETNLILLAVLIIFWK